MYVNRETKKPAWLVSQDGDGVTYSDGDRRHSCSSFEFFHAHREATAAEIRDHRGETRHETARDMRQAAAKPAPKAAAKPKAAKPPAKPKAARAARKPAATRAAMQQGATPEPAPAPPATPPQPQVRVEPLK